jgi:RNA polymerase sigma-70 factor, ECF subfamily
MALVATAVARVPEVSMEVSPEGPSESVGVSREGPSESVDVATRGSGQAGGSFEELAREQLPRLYAIARRLVGEGAEDAVQEALLKGFERFDQLDDFGAGPAWLTRILVNCCHDRGRRAARRPQEIQFDEAEDFSLYRKIALEDPFPYSDSLHLDFLGEFAPEDVRQVLLRLPELYRVPLVLVHMYGYPTQETAEILEAPLGTVLARLHRGRKLFERELWDYAEETGMLEGGNR